MCHERGARDHTHLFVVLHERPAHLPVGRFDAGNMMPNASPSSARGKSARRSWDRAHVYAVCPFKDTHLWAITNYAPGKDYAVETVWVTTLWRQHKLTNVVECCAHYRCLTPTLENVVTRTELKSREVRRRVMLEDRERVLRQERKDCRVVHAVEYWREQYESVRVPYQCL